MAITHENIEYGSQDQLTGLRSVLRESGMVKSTIHEIIADTTINTTEIRRKVEQEELNTAKLAWKLLAGKGRDGVHITTTIFSLPGEIFHSESRNEVSISLSDGTTEFGHMRSRLKYLAVTSNSTDISQMIKDKIKPDRFAKGSDKYQVVRLFDEARTAERSYKEAKNNGNIKGQSYFEKIRYQVITNALEARKHFLAFRELIAPHTFEGRVEPMICIRFIIPDAPYPEQSNRVNMPWTADLDEIIRNGGGYVPRSTFEASESPPQKLS